MTSWCASKLVRSAWRPLLCTFLMVWGATPAWAVPSFARQTGMACAACHTVFPELTHFGRVFKANGYVLDNLQQVQAVSSKQQELLELAKTPALSIMAQVSYTELKTRLPDVKNPRLTGQVAPLARGEVDEDPRLAGLLADAPDLHLGAGGQLSDRERPEILLAVDRHLRIDDPGFHKHFLPGCGSPRLGPRRAAASEP